MASKSLTTEISYWIGKSIFWLRRFIRWLQHPVVVFGLLQIIWVSITVMWLVWFADVNKELTELAKALGSSGSGAQYALAFLNIGCVVLGMLLVGTFVVFVFAQRQSHLIRKQRSFFSSVTHELRSPLSSLQLAIETLKTYKMDETTQTRMYNMILSDIKRLLRLIDNVLTSAKLDRGIASTEKITEKIQISGIIRKAVETSSYLDQNLPARVKIDCPENLIANITESALTLVINNIVENAVKYSPENSPIEIKAVLKGDMIIFSVKDQGIGLEHRDQKQVFDKFYRAEEVTRKAISGTGLGLYIVRATIKLLGGDVWVESPGPAKGSTFFVAIPAFLQKENDK